MPKWIGNRFGSTITFTVGNNAPSAIYNSFDQYYAQKDGAWTVPNQQVWSNSMTGTWTNQTNAFDNDVDTYAQISGMGDPQTESLLVANPTYDVSSNVKIKGHCTSGQIRVSVPGASDIDWYSNGGIQEYTFSTTGTVGTISALSVSPSTTFRLYSIKFDDNLLIDNGPGFPGFNY